MLSLAVFLGLYIRPVDDAIQRAVVIIHRLYVVPKILEQKIQYLNLEDEIKCLLQIF